MLVGRGPDVLFLSEERLPAYVANDWVVELADVLDTHGVAVESFDYAVDVPRMQEYLRYAFPFTLASYRLVYNREAFRRSGLDPHRPPRTLEELYLAARSIQESRGKSIRAFALPLAEGIRAFREHLEIPALRNGLRHFHGEPVRYDLSVYERWLTRIVQMDNEELLLPGWKNLSKGGAIENFVRGNVAMIIVNSGDFALLRRSLRDDLDVAVAPVPDLIEPGDGGINRVSSFLAVNATCSRPSNSLLVWQHLVSRHTQQQLLEHETALTVAALELEDRRALGPHDFSFAAFLPALEERLELFPQNRYDSPFLYDGLRSALLGDLGRIDAVLRETSVVCRERVIAGVRGTTFR
jgi:multiple sugar transport system substrate-binding protein